MEKKIQTVKNINVLAKKSKLPSKFMKKYIVQLNRAIESVDANEIDKLVYSLEKARKGGNTIFLIGNGGSATTASSMANDLGFDIVKKTKTKKPFKFLSLTDNNSVVTAIANDIGYDEIFLNQLKIHFRKGDQLIAISASGNSPNILKAVKWFKNQKGKVISFLGFDGGKLLKLSDIVLHVKTQKGEDGPVEDAHLIINHILAHWFQSTVK